MPPLLAREYLQTLDRKEKRRLTRLFFDLYHDEPHEEVCVLWVEELRKVGIDMDRPRIEAILGRE